MIFQNQAKSRETSQTRKTSLSSAKSKSPATESTEPDNTEKLGRTSNRKQEASKRVEVDVKSPSPNTRGNIKIKGNYNKHEKLKHTPDEVEAAEDEIEDEIGASTVTIIPRYGPSSKDSVTESGDNSHPKDKDETRKRRDSSPQVVLSPTSKYITGKTGNKSQIFKLSLAPGSEGQLIQAGGTVKIGSTLLKITPKSGQKSGAKKDGGTLESQPEKSEGTDQEDYPSSLDTSIDEFQILDQSLEGEEDENVSYPSVQQDAFFSAFGLVKKSELPKDGTVNKLHRLAGGKLRRVLKPNFAPGMVYKDGKVVVEDTTECSPRSKAKLLTKGTTPISQKLDFSEVTETSPSNSPKPKKREWLKPPPRRSKSPIRDDSKIVEITPTKSSQVSGKSKEHQRKAPVPEERLKKQSSFLGEKASKKPSAMTKTKSSNDIDLNMLPSRRSSRQRDSKRKEWKHLLRACPDEFEEDPKWEEEIDKRRHRSQTRMAKKLEREQKSEAETQEISVDSEPDSEKSDEEIAAEKHKIAKTAKAKARREQRKEVEKQIKEASSSKKYAEIYDEIVLKRGSFDKIRKQSDWGLAKKMLDEEQRKAKQSKLEAVKLMDSVEKGKSKVVTKGMGVYEGVSWEMSHIEDSNSPRKNQTTVETVTEEIITPDGQIIKVKVEKDLDEEDEDTPVRQRKKKKKVKEKDAELIKESDTEERGSAKMPLSPKFVKMPVPLSPAVKVDEPSIVLPPADRPSRNEPMIVILGPDGKPLPPARSSYLCEKIRSTLEEVVQKPEMLRKGRVLELKVPKHKLLPTLIGQSKNTRETVEKEETSPTHQSFLPIVSVKTDYQRELECQVPHMCNICWINDHMYCTNMKRLEQDLPYTGGCMHYVPCRHYMHLQEHKMVNKARFLSVRKWQELLAEKYFDSRPLVMEADSDEYETEDLALIEDEDGNFIAVNASGVKLGDEKDICFEKDTNSTETFPEEESAEATSGTSPQPYISSSQDSGYHSELPGSQQTNAGDTSMDSMDTEDISVDEEDASSKPSEETIGESSSAVPTITVTSPASGLVPKKSGVVRSTVSSETQLVHDELMCDEEISDSDTETEFGLTPPIGTEILHVQIRARAAQIARSLIFDETTISAAKSLCSVEDKEEDIEPEIVNIEKYGAEVIVGESKESADEKLVKSLLYPEKCPTHYEFVHDDNSSHSEIEETSEFIDIRGRKHRVIKVHIAKLDDETRDELLKSLSSEGKKDSRSLANHPSQTPDYKTTRKRKRTGSTDSNESDEGEIKKKPSPSGNKKGLMQKTDVHQFSLKTHKAMRGPLTATTSHSVKSSAKVATGEDEKVLNLT